jgi:hypothetical protein
MTAFNTTLLSKTCPHCGKANQLTFVDLFRSFYLRTPYDNSVARHYCHHCHSGWNVRWFFTCTFAVYILVFTTALLILRFAAVGFNASFLLLIPIFIGIDFAFKAVLVYFLPLEKQF